MPFRRSGTAEAERQANHADCNRRSGRGGHAGRKQAMLKAGLAIGRCLFLGSAVSCLKP